MNRDSFGLYQLLIATFALAPASLTLMMHLFVSVTAQPSAVVIVVLLRHPMSALLPLHLTHKRSTRAMSIASASVFIIINLKFVNCLTVGGTPSGGEEFGELILRIDSVIHHPPTTLAVTSICCRFPRHQCSLMLVFILIVVSAYACLSGCLVIILLIVALPPTPDAVDHSSLISSLSSLDVLSLPPTSSSISCNVKGKKLRR